MEVLLARKFRTPRTVTAPCRRCGEVDHLDRRQLLCPDCYWELGLTSLTSGRVHVEPIAQPDPAAR
jgi:hypothetical protein